MIKTKCYYYHDKLYYDVTKPLIMTKYPYNDNSTETLYSSNVLAMIKFLKSFKLLKFG